MDADINEANWHPECSVLVRDLKVRVYVKKRMVLTPCGNQCGLLQILGWHCIGISQLQC